jgi:hypothetical protein
MLVLRVFWATALCASLPPSRHLPRPAQPSQRLLSGCPMISLPAMATVCVVKMCLVLAFFALCDMVRGISFQWRCSLTHSLTHSLTLSRRIFLRSSSHLSFHVAPMLSHLRLPSVLLRNPTPRLLSCHHSTCLERADSGLLWSPQLRHVSTLSGLVPHIPRAASVPVPPIQPLAHISCAPPPTPTQLPSIRLPSVPLAFAGCTLGTPIRFDRRRRWVTI